MKSMLQKLKSGLKQNTGKIVLFCYALLLGTSLPIALSRCSANCFSCGSCTLYLGIIPLVTAIALRNKIRQAWLQIYRSLLRIKKAIVLIIPVVCLLFPSSCSTPEKAEALTLEFIPKPAISTLPAGQPLFNEKNSLVLRCTSITEKEDGITVTVTKAKSARIQNLIFVNQTDLENSQSASAAVAYIKIKGIENDFDISDAVYRSVALASVSESIRRNGLPYDDWLVGTMNQDDLFPCCK